MPRVVCCCAAVRETTDDGTACVQSQVSQWHAERSAAVSVCHVWHGREAKEPLPQSPMWLQPTGMSRREENRFRFRGRVNFLT